MKSFFLGALLLCAGISANAQSHYWCEIPSRVVQYPDSLPARLTDLRFTSADDFSFSDMKLFNKRDKPIEHILFVVELLDEHKEHLLSMLFYNRTLKPEPPFNFEFKPWLQANGSHYIEPIEPLVDTRVQSFSPAVTFKCPTAAEVTLFDLQYSDGEVFEYKAHSLNLDAMISRAPLFNTKVVHKWAPVTVTGSIDVDAEGVGILEDLDVDQPELRDWLVAQLKRWKFSPKIIAGQRTSGTLWFVLSIGEGPLDFTKFIHLKEEGAPLVFSLRAASGFPFDDELLVGGFKVSEGRKR